MTTVLILAAAAAAINIAAGSALGLGSFSNIKAPQALAQAAGFAARLAVILGGAHWLWTTRGRAVEAVVFIVAAATFQVAGQAAILVGRQGASR